MKIEFGWKSGDPFALLSIAILERGDGVLYLLYVRVTKLVLSINLY